MACCDEVRAMVRLSGAELQCWRRQQLACGTAGASALDWLLELEGGLAWRQLQRSHLDPEQLLELRCSLQHLEQLWQRHHQQQVPLQHLVGRAPWRDLNLQVSPAVLIPRQETELLVDLAVDTGCTPQRWADLGTGSGCLALALARQWPGSEGWAVDCSADALLVAQANAAELPQPHGRLHWRRGRWWEPLLPLAGRLQLVVSNPPYIPSGVVDGLEPLVREHEPRLALDGGADGLDDLRCIIGAAPAMLSPGGWLLLEHHHDQSAQVLELLHLAGLQQCRPAHDLEGKLRFALARAPQP